VLPFEDVDNFDPSLSLGCIDTFFRTENSEKEFTINNNKEYRSLITYKSSSPFCKDLVLPTIDFSQKTLLGKYASGGGCTIDFMKKLYKDDTERKALYIIDVIEKGACNKLEFSMNWILSPKIPSDYLIQFQVK